MSDVWQLVTWADVEQGDYVRRPGQSMIYRVDVAEPQGASVALTLFSPTTNVVTGVLGATKPVEVRIKRADELTPAGRRWDGLSPAGERALKEQLGVEMIAQQELGGSELKPWVVFKSINPSQLASHLFLFHQLGTQGATSRDAVELRAAHKAFHTADPRLLPETARRVPHVHQEEK